MKTLVLHFSNAGNTKAYAERIASAVGADVLPFRKRKFKKMDLSSYDAVVFGGWVQGSEIQGLNDFLSRWEDMEKKSVIVFSVGMSYVSKESRDNLISANLLDMYHLRFYQLRGSFDYGKLRFPQNMFLKIGIRNAIRAQDANTDIEFLQSVMEKPFIFDDKEGTDRIVAVLNRISAEGTK